MVKINEESTTGNEDEFLPRIFTTLSTLGEVSQTDLQDMIRISKQNLYYYKKSLSEKGLVRIRKQGKYNYWSLTNDGKNIDSKNFYQDVVQYETITTNQRIENFQIYVALEQMNFGYLERHAEVNDKLKNNKQYTLKNNPFNITLVFTTKGVKVYIPLTKVEPTEQGLAIFRDNVFNTLFSVLRWIERLQIGYVVEGSIEGLYNEIANQLHDSIDKKTPKRVKSSLDLQRPATTLLGETKYGAKAWIDKSYDIAEIESNDLSYQQKLLRMPEMVHQMSQIIPVIIQNEAVFSENHVSHVALIQEIALGLQETRKATQELTQAVLSLKGGND